MKTAAVIAEYNPFHNGHAAQLRDARARYGADCGLIVMMSGPFCQRGVPALCDKFVRADMALQQGADLVFELPVYYATGHAGRFAYGAVAGIAATGICRDLFCGSESGETALLRRAADLLADEPVSFREKLHEALAEGKSYAAARAEALVRNEAFSPEEGRRLQAALTGSNDILALSYFEAIKKGGFPLGLALLPRHGRAEEKDPAPSDASAHYASASALRELLAATQGQASVLFGEARRFLPPESVALLAYEAAHGRLCSSEALARPAYLALVALDLEACDTMPELGEGLGRRLKRLAPEIYATTPEGRRFEALVSAASGKRHPATRVRRALLHLVLGADRFVGEDTIEPPYLRVLGFTKRGRYLLKTCRRRASIPLMTRGSDSLEIPAERTFARKLAALDRDAEDVAALLRGDAPGHDFRHPPVRRR